MGTATAAARVQRLLVRNGIPSRLIKITDSRHGCSHGVSIRYTDFFATVGILKENGIDYSVYSH